MMLHLTQVTVYIIYQQKRFTRKRFRLILDAKKLIKRVMSRL